MDTQEPKSNTRMEDRYSGQSPELYPEAGENFDAYLAVIIRIYERLSADPDAYTELRAELCKRHSDL